MNDLRGRMNNLYSAWAARRRVPLGFVLGLVYLIFAQPTPTLLLSGGALALAGLGLRTLAAGYLEKSKSLAISGPYRLTRNPLYFGSFLMGVGFSLAGGSLALGLAFLSFFLLVYWPVMRLEEDTLRRQFGEVYDHYASRVSLFFPLRQATFIPGSKFDWAKYRTNREYRAILGYLAGMVFLALKMELR